ncbi:MAG: hypothetical protein ACT6XY_07015 [Phreatobacter sp.]|uniref:hypothetical protein n=1 Tax=Phreatobacter sp. TaxID=1966341 RepID=UPI004036E48D
MIDNETPGMNTATGTAGNGDGGGSATGQLKAAGIDTERMASRAGEITQLIRDEVAARPFQAVMAAAFVGFLYALRR